MRWQTRLAWVVGIASASVIGLYYMVFGPTYTWRQTLTVVVETPGGTKSGSATVEVKRWLKHMVPGSGTLGGGSFHGEATVVEVAPGRYLFALLRTLGSVDHPKYIATAAFKDRLPMNDANGTWSKLSSLHATRPVPRKQFPMLVTFEDASNPKSVKLVDPDNLAADFGSGFKLKSISLSLSDGPITDGEVSKILPWLHSPDIVQNPVWRNLPHLLQRTIIGLKKPMGKS